MRYMAYLASVVFITLFGFVQSGWADYYILVTPKPGTLPHYRLGDTVKIRLPEGQTFDATKKATLFIDGLPLEQIEKNVPMGRDKNGRLLLFKLDRAPANKGFW